MRIWLIFFLISNIFAMDQNKVDTKIDIEESPRQAEMQCECKLCKGIKIAVATNIISVIVATTATMLINYSQCD